MLTFLYRKLVRHTAEDAMVEDSSNLRRANSSDSGLSAWEIWLIQKAKEERKLRRQIRQQHKQEKLDQMAKVKLQNQITDSSCNCELCLPCACISPITSSSPLVCLMSHECRAGDVKDTFLPVVSCCLPPKRKCCNIIQHLLESCSSAFSGGETLM
jgi:hypothetical protein